MTELGPKHPRVRDPGYLVFVRQQPCCLCGADRVDAAHIRSGSIAYDKPSTGMAEKPDDRWSLPLCRSDHNRQHHFGNELEFWRQNGIDPFALAQRYYARYQAQGGGKTTTKKPKSRVEIKSRGFNKGKRKIQSRPFQRRKSNGQMG